MNRVEEVQYHLAHIGIFRGAEMPPAVPPGSCEACGREVLMDTPLSVGLYDSDGLGESQEVTEGAARLLLGELGIAQPPILCREHEESEMTWEMPR